MPADYQTRPMRTDAGSTVKLSGAHGGIVDIDFDWFEEDHACIDCLVDIDATRDTNFYLLVWDCETCGGGAAELTPFTP